MKTGLQKILATLILVSGYGVGTLGGAASVQASEAEYDVQAFARGARLWADNCSRCHNMRAPRELRDDQWRAVVAHMRVRAGLTGKETEAVLVFLQQSN